MESRLIGLKSEGTSLILEAKNFAFEVNNKAE